MKKAKGVYRQWTSVFFARLCTGEIPSKTIYEDDAVKAFADVDPKAPVHILIVPKEHMENQLDPRAAELAPHLFTAVQTIAKQYDLEADGFRCVINTGRDGGQTVGHLHMHMLAGRALWAGRRAEWKSRAR